MDRRVTVSSTIYPKIEQLAQRDQVTVADVVNAILLQTLQPYGRAVGQSMAPPVPTLNNNYSDPYQSTAVSDW